MKTTMRSVAIGLFLAASAWAGTPTITNITQLTAHATLADAIVNSAEGDVIEIGVGTLSEWGLILNNANITIRGAGRELTIIDADYNGRVFRMQSGDASTIEDLTIRRGVPVQANGGGAAQIATDHQVTFHNVDIRECDGTGFGNGAVNMVVSSASVRFDACRFIDNMNGNNASACGGFGTVLFLNCLFAGNSGSNRTLRPIGSFSLVNCTFADNTDGWAIHRGGSGSAVSVANCVFDGSNPSGSVENGISVQACLYPGAPALNINGTPTFVDALGGDYRLAAGSLGIDAADEIFYSIFSGGPIDLNGDPRIYDDPATVNTGSGAPDFLDLGAYEFQGVTCGDGDYDCDGDVDLGDFSQFSLCFGGPNVPPAGTCPPAIDADLDNDGDVDLGDFSLFSLNFTGPQ